jgi:hypothetical protein
VRAIEIGRRRRVGDDHYRLCRCWVHGSHWDNGTVFLGRGPQTVVVVLVVLELVPWLEKWRSPTMQKRLAAEAAIGPQRWWELSSDDQRPTRFYREEQ